MDDYVFVDQSDVYVEHFGPEVIKFKDYSD